MIKQVGELIEWEHNGKAYRSEILFLDCEEKCYGVYAEYGQDFIPFDKIKVDMKQEIKERLSFKTTPTLWAKVRNVAAFVAALSGVMLSDLCPFELPEKISDWLKFVVAVSGAITVNSHLTKK